MLENPVTTSPGAKTLKMDSRPPQDTRQPYSVASRPMMKYHHVLEARTHYNLGEK